MARWVVLIIVVGIVTGSIIGAISALLGFPAWLSGGLSGAAVVVVLQLLRKKGQPAT